VRASVVVVPRERFSSLPVSLRSLFSTVGTDVPVLVVEGGSPPAVRAELEHPGWLVALEEHGSDAGAPLVFFPSADVELVADRLLAASAR